MKRVEGSPNEAPSEWGDVADGQSGGLASGGTGGKDGVFSPREQRPGVFEQRAAGRRELHTVGVPQHELGPHALFELADLAAERLLGEVQPLRGAGEVELLRHRQQRAQVPHLKVHGADGSMPATQHVLVLGTNSLRFQFGGSASTMGGAH